MEFNFVFELSWNLKSIENKVKIQRVNKRRFKENNGQTATDIAAINQRKFFKK